MSPTHGVSVSRDQKTQPLDMDSQNGTVLTIEEEHFMKRYMKPKTWIDPHSQPNFHNSTQHMQW
jgi:hypothetical protein